MEVFFCGAGVASLTRFSALTKPQGSYHDDNEAAAVQRGQGEVFQLSQEIEQANQAKRAKQTNQTYFDSL